VSSKLGKICFLAALLVVPLAMFFLSAEEAPLKTANVKSPYRTRARMQADDQPPSVHAPIPDTKESLRPAKRVVSISTDRSYPGVTIIPQSGNEKIDLIDKNGALIHQWNFDAARARLLPNCNLLVVHGSKWGLMREPWSSLKHFVREYDWDGNLQWEFKAPGAVHHDVQRLPNGNTIFLYRSVLPEEQRALLKDPARRELVNRSDGIMEVTPQKEVVWDWKLHEHFDPNACGSEPCPFITKRARDGKKEYDWTHSNSVTVIPPNRWFDAGDARFKPGNLMILVRNWSTVYVIERPSGKPVWSYHGTYKGGLSGGHEAFMITDDLPGAGNILVFDNGRDKGTSFALEIAPDTKEVVWAYDVGDEFYSGAAGTLQRLPNGNTLISEDVPGRNFEVTPEGKKVWEVKNPYRTCRPHRYPYGYCPNLKEPS